jgi:predicted DsbA family dithiol-disulfide isomerase
MAKFDMNGISEQIYKQIYAGINKAKILGLTVTSCFIINGVAVRGTKSADYFEKIIDRLLTETNKPKKWLFALFG